MKILTLFSYLGLVKNENKSWGEPYTFLDVKTANPLGMAAGFDKNAQYVKTLENLGFGYVEIGTVTPRPQSGNEKPRLFRLKKEDAIMNRMGFNNQGVDSIVSRLKKYKNRTIAIGGNIGKNKDTPIESAYVDYKICFEKLYAYVDYFTVNVSSPNTQNLRDLQSETHLMKIFDTLDEYRKKQAIYKPIFLKLAPDLTSSQLDEIVAIFNNLNAQALVIANTTIDHTILTKEKNHADEIGSGGVSGHPIFDKTMSMVSYIKKQAPNIPIIGVGGIDSPLRAQEYLDQGCVAIQLYSGFIYQGPSLIKDILNHIKIKK